MTGLCSDGRGRRWPSETVLPGAAVEAQLELLRQGRGRGPAVLRRQVEVLRDGHGVHYLDPDGGGSACGLVPQGERQHPVLGMPRLAEEMCARCAERREDLHAPLLAVAALQALGRHTARHADPAGYLGALATLGARDAALASLGGEGLDEVLTWLGATRAVLDEIAVPSARAVCWPLAVELAAGQRGLTGEAERVLGNGNLVGWLAEQWAGWAWRDLGRAVPLAHWHAELCALGEVRGVQVEWLPETARSFGGGSLRRWALEEWRQAVGPAVAALVTGWSALAERLVALEDPVVITAAEPGRSVALEWVRSGRLGGSGARLWARWPAGDERWELPLLGALWLAQHRRLDGWVATARSARAAIALELVDEDGLGLTQVLDLADAASA